MGALAANRRHLRRRRAHEQRAVAVEVRLAAIPVIRVLLADPVRALDVLDEGEGPGAHHVLFVPADVFREDVGLVDPAVGGGQRHEERCLRPLEPEADRRRIRRLDRFDGAVLALAIRRRLRRREHDLVVARLRIARRHDGAVVEAYAGSQLQCVDEPVGRNRPRLREVGHDLRAGSIERIDAQQRVVVRRQRVHDAEGALFVAVIGRRLGRHEEDQLATGTRLVLSERR